MREYSKCLWCGKTLDVSQDNKELCDDCGRFPSREAMERARFPTGIKTKQLKYYRLFSCEEHKIDLEKAILSYENTNQLKGIYPLDMSEDENCHFCVSRAKYSISFSTLPLFPISVIVNINEEFKRKEIPAQFILTSYKNSTRKISYRIIAKDGKEPSQEAYEIADKHVEGWNKKIPS